MSAGTSLTQEQKKRMEENKQKAMALRQAKSSFKPPPGQPQNAVKTIQSSTLKSKAPQSSNLKSMASWPPYKNNFYASQKQSSPNKPKPKEFTRVMSGALTLMSRERFELVMDYHAPTIEAVKSIPGREYNINNKRWNFPLSQYEKALTVLKGLRPSVLIGELPNLVIDTFLKSKQSASVPEINLNRIQSSMRATLLEFQLEGVKYAVRRGGRVLIADDMGLGKTIQALAIADYYQSDWPLLIVCPSSMRFQWMAEISKHLKNVTVDTIFVITNGKELFRDDCQVVITSYDLMSTFKDKLFSRNFGVIIMDESHHLKNPKALRTKSATELITKCKRCVLLSGTPVLSRPVELHCQLKCIRPNLFKNFMDFAVRYCDAKEGKFGWDFSGSSNMTELSILIKELMMIRRLKSEVLAQLPPKKREVVVLESSGKKLRDTSEFAKILENEGLKGVEKRSTLLAYFRETGEAKIKGISQYIADMIENGEKFLVFAHHAVVMDSICAAVEAKKTDYIRIDGSVNSETRKQLCTYFQEQEKCLVAVLSIKAANTGLTLTAARLVIFAELYWNPGDLIQAEDRAHRIGQEDSVLVQYLVQKGTADDHIWPLVQDKLDLLHKAGLSQGNFGIANTVKLKSKEQKEVTEYFLSDEEQVLAGMDLSEFENDFEIPEKKPRLE